jgi:hypothetical protein
MTPTSECVAEDDTLCGATTRQSEIAAVRLGVVVPSTAAGTMLIQTETAGAGDCTEGASPVGTAPAHNDVAGSVEGAATPNADVRTTSVHVETEGATEGVTRLNTATGTTLLHVDGAGAGDALSAP